MPNHPDAASESASPAPAGNESILTLLEVNVGKVPTLDLLAASPEERVPSLPATPDGNRYAEVGPIGQGGLGEVVAVFDHDLRRTVALKRTRPDRTSATATTRLVEEAQVTAQLEHPAIPPVYSLGIGERGQPYFTMTRVEGMTLSELLHRRVRDPDLQTEFPTSRLLRIVLQVGYALAFAHARGVLHRDVKPENIMLGRFGEVRLMDWGLAKVMAASGEVSQETGEAPDLTAVEVTTDRVPTVEGVAAGTPGYMSPEQADGRADLDARTDVYALGAVLYEVLAGRPPVTGGSVAEMLMRTVRGEVPRLADVSPAIPSLCTITHRALATDRDQRYASISVMLRDLEAAMDGRTLPSERHTWLYKLGKTYFSRNARMARLRTVDVDLMGFGSWFLGMACAIWCAAYLEHPAAPWVLAALGVLLCIPMTYTFLRKPRPDDPGQAGRFAEGVSRAATASPSTRSPEPEASTLDAPQETGNSLPMTQTQEPRVEDPE